MSNLHEASVIHWFNMYIKERSGAEFESGAQNEPIVYVRTCFWRKTYENDYCHVYKSCFE